MRVDTHRVMFASLGTPFSTGKKVGQTRSKSMYPNMASTGQVELMSLNFCDDQAIDQGHSFEVGCVMKRYVADEMDGLRILYHIRGSVWVENNQHDIVPFIGILDSETVTTGIANGNNRCQRWWALPVGGNSVQHSASVDALVSIETAHADANGPVVVGVSYRASVTHTGEYGCSLSARIYKQQLSMWDPYR